jgi:hypothetical protein
MRLSFLRDRVAAFEHDRVATALNLLSSCTLSGGSLSAYVELTDGIGLRLT